MEEVVMTIHTHPHSFPVRHTIDTTQFFNASQLVTKKTGMIIQPNKAIVGANAFAHESGIHQDGYLKNKSTYEIISPEILGIPKKALVLGKHSGRNALNSRIDELVKNTIYEDFFAQNPNAYQTLFVAFKKLADTRKTGVTDQDLFALLDEEFNLTSTLQSWKFHSLSVISGTGILSTATVSLVDSSVVRNQETEMEVDGAGVVTDAATGHGPVNAIFNAISRLVGCSNILASYDVNAVSGGSDSLGRVTVRIFRQDDCSAPSDKSDEAANAKSNEKFQGQGTDEDVLVASAKAYVNAVNKMINAEKRSVSMSNTQLQSRNVEI